VARKKKIEDSAETSAAEANSENGNGALPKSKRKAPAGKRKLESAGAVSAAAGSVLQKVAFGGSENLSEEASAASSEGSQFSSESQANSLPKHSSKNKFNFNDIKPKSANNDASFLAPEKFTFDLKKQKPFAKNPRRAHSKWVKTLVYFLSGIIVLMAAALLILTFYSAKILNLSQPQTGNIAMPAQDNTAQTSSSATNSGTAQASKLAIGLVNISEPAKSLIANALQSVYTIDSAQTASAVPAATTDTLYLKSSAQAKSQDILAALAQLGLKPQIQNKEDVADDAILYLVSTLQNPNFSGLTASVYNATGIAGTAKKYCDILNTFKITACSALNSPSRQTGLSVATKSSAVIVNLSRTSQFQSAQFVAPAQGQIEDIRVTVGK
jgi:hypothetical protein